MTGILTEDTKAIILLCGILGKKASVNPLSQTEYTKLVRWLIRNKLRPASLLDPSHIKEAASGSGLDESRLEVLLGRGTQLGFAVENWQRNGIWVISRSDADYPVRYKKHLKEKAPPLLFGVGERSLLHGGGLAMVGSRNVDAMGEAFTRDVATCCAQNSMPVVSGGARGVDQVSMESALAAGGTSIGIMADNLLKKSLGKNFRKAIAAKRLLLISPYHPEAPFRGWAAMGRNKLIYAMADFALVVSSDHKKGGTWAGATEEMKRDVSIPVFVRIDDKTPKGNQKLLDAGAVQWPSILSSKNLNSLLHATAQSFVRKKTQATATLFDQVPQTSPPLLNEKGLNEKSNEKDKETKEASYTEHPCKEPEPEPEKECPASGSLVYDLVLPVILEALATPLSATDLAQRLDLQKGQLDIWLKKALADKKIKKLTRPVRYQRLER